MEQTITLLSRQPVDLQPPGVFKDLCRCWRVLNEIHAFSDMLRIGSTLIDGLPRTTTRSTRCTEVVARLLSCVLPEQVKNVKADDKEYYSTVL